MRREAKQILKITTDLLMTVLLLLLMAYSLVGEAAHEWLGVAIFLLFILHHILNRKWCRNLMRGNYPPIRILQTVLVLFVLLSMAGSMVSGILLSRYVFRLDVHRFSAVFRKVHMLSTYWGFVFLSLHLGLHWGKIMGMARKLTKPVPAGLCCHHGTVRLYRILFGEMDDFPFVWQTKKNKATVITVGMN